MERNFKTRPAFDRIPEGYGIHGLDITFSVKEGEYILYYTIFTNWMLPQNRGGKLGEKEFYPFTYWRMPTTAGCDLFKVLPDGKLEHIDGTSLTDDLFELFISKGQDGLYQALEERLTSWTK